MRLIPPPGMVAVEIGKGCLLVIPERVPLARLKPGKLLRHRQVETKRVVQPSKHSDNSRTAAKTDQA